MILEGLVTTIGVDGRPNLAPMGPIVEDDDVELSRFVLRPFATSTTYRNLKETGQGVFHVTDDVLLIALAAIGRQEMENLESRPATRVRGLVLSATCRYYEFRVVAEDARDDRTTLEVETLARGALRPFFGFNRAKHAVIEAAILATRVGLIPASEILAELERLSVPVRKTAGAREREAFELLRGFVSESIGEAGR